MPDRRQPVYNTEERAVIDVYKAEYLNIASPEERKQLAQTKILPAIFNYWSQKGIEIADPTLRTKTLVYWMQNNWRSSQKSKVKSATFTVKRSEVIWKERKDEVFAEIANLLHLESADTNTPGWFGMRMKALGNVHDRMTDKEQVELNAQVARLTDEGYSDERKRRYAEKYSRTRLDVAAKENWLEMGLLSITFATRTTPDGQLAIELHDQIATLLGVAADPFIRQHKAQITEMQRLILRYVKSLQDMSNIGGGMGSAPGQASAPIAGSATGTHLKVDEAGFPELSPLCDPRKCTKKELETLMREYLAQHYRIVSKGRSHQPPYTSMAKDMSKYIDPEHLPTNFTIRDPRNMKQSQIVLFFEHIAARQRSYSLPDTFRFKTAKKGRKGNKTVDEAPDDSDSPDPDHQRNADADLNPNPEPDSESNADPEPAPNLDMLQNIITDDMIDPLLLAASIAAPQKPAPQTSTDPDHQPNADATPNPNLQADSDNNADPQHTNPDHQPNADATPNPNPEADSDNNADPQHTDPDHQPNADADLSVLPTASAAAPQHPAPRTNPAPRTTVNTADNLALQEAMKYMVTGRRERRPRRQG